MFPKRIALLVTWLTNEICSWKSHSSEKKRKRKHSVWIFIFIFRIEALTRVWLEEGTVHTGSRGGKDTLETTITHNGTILFSELYGCVTKKLEIDRVSLRLQQYIWTKWHEKRENRPHLTQICSWISVPESKFRIGREPKRLRCNRKGQEIQLVSARSMVRLGENGGDG